MMKASPKLIDRLRKTEAFRPERFQHDIRLAERIVERAVRVPLTQQQFDALVMIAFQHAGLALSLRQKLNAGDMKGAVEIMRMRSRNEEISIFEHGVTV